MIIRPLEIEDVEIIDEFYRKFYQDDFYLPSLKNTITHAVVENDKKILGFGEVKVFAEAIMVLDMDQPKRVRAKVMRALMTKAIMDTKQKGIEQLHVSVKEDDERFADILREHYEFETVRNIILARRLVDL